MAKYSIILPVRNGGEYIKKCIESIFAQTFNDFNLIVLDNCSTDGTKEWVGSIDDKRLQVLTSETPLNIEESWARITGIRKNDFITIIGHDDILYPEFLQTIDEMVVNNPSASLFFTHFDLIDGAGQVIRPGKTMSATYTGEELLKAFLINSIDIMGTGYVMRAKDYDRLGGIPAKYPSLLFADFELWINLAKISFEVVSPLNCFAFRIHQSTSGSSQDIRLHEAMNIFINYLSLLCLSDEKMRKTISDYGNEFLLFHCKGFSHRILRTRIEQRNCASVEKIINQSKVWAKKIGLEKKYKPEKSFPIWIAKIIDSNRLLQKFFLFFKKVFPKPFF